MQQSVDIHNLLKCSDKTLGPVLKSIFKFWKTESARKAILILRKFPSTDDVLMFQREIKKPHFIRKGLSLSNL